MMVSIVQCMPIDQLRTRAKEFNGHDVTSGCSFAATLSIVVNGRNRQVGG